MPCSSSHPDSTVVASLPRSPFAPAVYKYITHHFLFPSLPTARTIYWYMKRLYWLLLTSVFTPRRGAWGSELYVAPYTSPGTSVRDPPEFYLYESAVRCGDCCSWQCILPLSRCIKDFLSVGLSVRSSFAVCSGLRHLMPLSCVPVHQDQTHISQLGFIVTASFCSDITLRSNLTLAATILNSRYDPSSLR
jgi:hypothetical protein